VAADAVGHPLERLRADGAGVVHLGLLVRGRRRRRRREGRAVGGGWSGGKNLLEGSRNEGNGGGRTGRGIRTTQLCLFFRERDNAGVGGQPSTGRFFKKILVIHFFAYSRNNTRFRDIPRIIHCRSRTLKFKYRGGGT
jgi:hypothetical protein